MNQKKVASSHQDVSYNIECGGHLKRAADANTVELAKGEMQVALKYMEARNMVSGYTSILYRTPDEDVGFWYRNFSAALKELQGVSLEATQLEKSNVLMKLRETLLDQRSSGVCVTEPAGISVFPNNTGYAVWGWVSAVLMISVWLGLLGFEFLD